MSFVSGFKFILLSAIVSLLVMRGFTFGGSAESVTIEWQITVPGKTARDAKVFLSGDRDELGDWDGKGVLATREADGSYHAKLNLPKNLSVEYKVTRGTWDTVERTATGADIANRTITTDGNKTIAITVADWADTAPRPAAVQSTATGDIHYHQAFHSKILGNDRRLIVWLPPQYQADPGAHFPVLYLQDGQNSFDASTAYEHQEWRADETADASIKAKKIPPLIIVGVENISSERLNEYTPTASEDKPGSRHGGGGEKYAQFLITEVKPFIDATYRTIPHREHTAVAGSSLGGLISLYLGWKHGDVFGVVGVLSPSLWWDNTALLKEIKADPAKLKDEKIWLDIGTAEDQKLMVEPTRAMAALLKTQFPDGKHFRYFEAIGGRHRTQDWAARFDQVLEFLYGN